MDAVYFELNNWYAGEDYPDAEPFLTWCGNDLNLYFNNEDFVKQHDLCVVTQVIDMSVNWCITAPKSFVLEYCPKLLSDEVLTTKYTLTSKDGTKETEKSFPYSRYLRFPEDGEDTVYGRFGAEFLEWSPENVGIKYVKDSDE